jgi:hypothetical protein
MYRLVWIILIFLLASSGTWRKYDEDWNAGNRYEKTDEEIEIYDEDWNRKGRIIKEDDDWVEYDKDWHKTKTYEDEDDD